MEKQVEANTRVIHIFDREGDIAEVFDQVRQLKHTTDAGELAEMIMSIIEGGFILSKSLQDAQLMARSVKQFRRYLQLIFEA